MSVGAGLQFESLTETILHQIPGLKKRSGTGREGITILSRIEPDCWVIL
jgi:hypothetical protein